MADQVAQIHKLDALDAALDAPDSFQRARELLQRLRRAPDARYARLTFRCATTVLNGSTVLGDEYWSIKEQLLLACCRLRMMGQAVAIAKELRGKFPESSRVEQLVGQVFEADSVWASAESGKQALRSAEEVAATELKKNSANKVVSQRQVALTRTHGSVKETVAAFNDHLETFADDADAWMQLAELHASMGHFAQASFCWEEVVMLQPGLFHAHLKLAECLLTMERPSDTDRLAARRHASFAVKLTGGCHLPAALVLQAACRAVARANGWACAAASASDAIATGAAAVAEGQAAAAAAGKKGDVAPPDTATEAYNLQLQGLAASVVGSICSAAAREGNEVLAEAVAEAAEAGL